MYLTSTSHLKKKQLNNRRNDFLTGQQDSSMYKERNTFRNLTSMTPGPPIANITLTGGWLHSL